MLRLSPLLVTAAALSEWDETSLIQGVKLPHVNKEDKSKSVSNLLETAKTMLKNGATNDVVTFAQDTLQEIKDAVLPKIWDAHRADQILVDQTHTMFQDAIDELKSGNVEIASLYTTERDHSDDHKACRGLEAVCHTGSECNLCQKKRDCDYELWAIWKHFAWEEADLRFKSSEIKSHFCALDANGTRWEFRDYSVTKFPSWIEQKGFVEEWEKTYDDKRPHCEAAYEALDAKTSVCDAHQTNLEDASCKFANKVREVRNRFALFWLYAVETYQRVVDEVHCLEIDRWKEWRTLASVQCLLNATLARNGRPCEEATPEYDSEVARCERVQTDTSIDDMRINVTYNEDGTPSEGVSNGTLRINFHEVPDDRTSCPFVNPADDCIPIDPNVPCTQGYLAQEYNALWQPPVGQFRAPDYHVDNHFSPTIWTQDQHHKRCPPGKDTATGEGETWARGADDTCHVLHVREYMQDPHTERTGAVNPSCVCPGTESDLTTHHWDQLDHLRTGNAHCNPRPVCVDCVLTPDTPQCEVMKANLLEAAINDHHTNAHVFPWVTIPKPAHECRPVTKRQIASGEGAFDAFGDGHFYPNGYQPAEAATGGSCGDNMDNVEFWLTDTRGTWENARQQCIEAGGDLVTMKDERKNAKVMAFFADSESGWRESGTMAWVGFHNCDYSAHRDTGTIPPVPRGCQWVDGCPLPYDEVAKPLSQWTQHGWRDFDIDDSCGHFYAPPYGKLAWGTHVCNYNNFGVCERAVSD